MAETTEKTTGKTAETAAEKAKKRESRFPKYFCIGTSLVLMFLAFIGYFYGMDRRFVDRLFLLRGMEEGDKRIVIVTIDDESITHVGSYPWKRGVYRKLLRRLFEEKVKTVGIDMLFPDPSPLPQEDAEFVKAAKEYGDRVVFGMNFELKPGVAGLNARMPYDALHKAAKHFGSAYQEGIDQDGGVRRVLLYNTPNTANVFDWNDYLTDPERIPGLAPAVLQLFTGAPIEDLVQKIGGNVFWLNIRGQKVLISDKGVETVIPGLKRIKAWRILENELNQEERDLLKGSIALIGSTAAGAFDHYPTPFNEQVPGVEVHANIIDNLLNDRWLRSMPVWLTLLLIVPMVLAARWLVTLPPLFAGLGFVGVMGAWVAVVYFVFLKLYVFDFTAPAAALGVTFLALMVHRAMLEVQQKREVRQMFGQYVAPEIVEQLVRDPDKLKLGGERRDMTIFFLDIAHFTTISEKMKAENLIQFLNHYLTALTDNILSNKGVVDKYIGDCIMAFWNAPLEDLEHRRNACFAAVDCVKTIQRLNREYVDPSIPEKPAVRIGLNSGDVVVGNTGSARKLQYTVLGDEVNLASRLEGANKFFGSTVMASEGTFKGLEGLFEYRTLGSVRVVGKEIPIKVFELLGRKNDVSPEWAKAIPIYQAGVDKFLAGAFEKASADFQEVIKLVPGDKPAKLYLNVCQDYMTIPPQGDWRVFNLTSK